jgi:predicted lipid-binding transport protein (Tim44 family)
MSKRFARMSTTMFIRLSRLRRSSETAEGLVFDNRLITIEQALIAAASLEQTVAFLTVRFEADIAAVTRNKDGEVVAGSMSDAVQTRDLWTFRRDTASRDPNWLLVETDEEE